MAVIPAPPGKAPAPMTLATEHFPAVAVPRSLLYCHPSRIGNVYEPRVDEIVQPELLIPGEAVGLAIRQGVTRDYPHQTRTGLGGRLRTAWEAGWRGRTADLGERLVYDARAYYNGNLTHLIQHHLAKLGYIRARLGHGPEAVTVVLAGKAPALALRTFAAAGYEVHRTNRAVAANLLEVDVREFFHLLPFVAALPIAGWRDDTPARIFIARRGSRRLLNGEEIAARLREQGYERVYFEDLALVEQWSLMKNAREIVAIHGAALGGLAFRGRQPAAWPFRLTEIFGPGFVTNVFRKYVAVLGGSWVGCRGKIRPEIVRDIDDEARIKKHAFDDFEIDPQVIATALAAPTRRERRLAPLLRAAGEGRR